mmetsp:Transcript_5271/g.9330  ORF Transcript_5271/g.9330 Transcript_5271/m.9330 type:complete len:224 (+) Transcript_5271:2258-2929(+)
MNTGFGAIRSEHALNPVIIRIRVSQTIQSKFRNKNLAPKGLAYSQKIFFFSQRFDTYPELCSGGVELKAFQRQPNNLFNLRNFFPNILMCVIQKHFVCIPKIKQVFVLQHVLYKPEISSVYNLAKPSREQEHATSGTVIRVNKMNLHLLICSIYRYCTIFINWVPTYVFICHSWKHFLDNGFGCLCTMNHTFIPAVPYPPHMIPMGMGQKVSAIWLTKVIEVD